MTWKKAAAISVVAQRYRHVTRAGNIIDKWEGPAAQPRIRAYSRGGKAGTYTPTTAEKWKSRILIAWCLYVLYSGKTTPGEWPLAGPVRVDIEFYFAHPRHHYARHGKSKNLRADAPTWHTIAPDIDNLAKAVYDALTVNDEGVGVWANDKAIVKGDTEKQYAPQGKPPGARVVIYRWVEGNGIA